jgi:hypothetical protein
MSDEKSDRILEIVTSLSNEITNIYESGKSELPTIAKEFIMNGIWTSLFEAILFGGALAAAFYLIKWTVKETKTDQRERFFSDYGDEIYYGIIGFVSGIAAIFLFCGFVMATETLITASVSPRVYLIKQAVSLTKH